MKDKKKVSVSSSSSRGANVINLKGVMILKKDPQHLIVPRLREYLIYSRLRSLIPPQPSQLQKFKDGSDEEKLLKSEEKEVEEEGQIENVEEDDIKSDKTTVEEEEEESEEGKERSNGFVPSIKIMKMDGSIFISTIVLKHASLTSTLFHLLEEEKLDIVFENQHRTDTKVAHTIHVKVQPGYDVDALERRLCTWARKLM